eukprot:4618723-Lingulodinium_polyedra.AAC.1
MEEEFCTDADGAGHRTGCDAGGAGHRAGCAGAIDVACEELIPAMPTCDGSQFRREKGGPL